MYKSNLLLLLICFLLSGVALADIGDGYVPIAHLPSPPGGLYTRGLLQIQNTSSYDMVLTRTHSYQMTVWNLPTSISSGNLAVGVIAFKSGNRHSVAMSDDAGDGYYRIHCPNGTVDTLHIMARLRSSPIMDIVQEGQHNCVEVTSPSNNALNIPWVNGAPKIVLADINANQ